MIIVPLWDLHSSKGSSMSYKDRQAMHRNNDLLQMQNLDQVPLIKEHIDIIFPNRNESPKCKNCKYCVDNISEGSFFYGDQEKYHCLKCLEYLQLDESYVSLNRICDLYERRKDDE